MILSLAMPSDPSAGDRASSPAPAKEKRLLADHPDSFGTVFAAGAGQIAGGDIPDPDQPPHVADSAGDKPAEVQDAEPPHENPMPDAPSDFPLVAPMGPGERPGADHASNLANIPSAQAVAQKEQLSTVMRSGINQSVTDMAQKAPDMAMTPHNISSAMAPNIELNMPGKRSVLLARDTPVQQGLPGSVPTISDRGKGVQTPTPPPAGALSATQDESQALSRLALQPESMSVTEFRTVMAEGPHAPRTAAPSSVPDLPRHVAAQLAEAVQRGAGPGLERAVELTLNPAELGRVRISMAPGDGMIVLTVLAERGETLDLMRRHADILAQEFHDLGYGTAEFTFGQSDGGASQDGDTGRSTPDAPTKAQDLPEPPDTPLTPLHVSTEHVDIRL